MNELADKLQEKNLSIGFSKNWGLHAPKKLKQIVLVNNDITTVKDMFEKIKWKPDHYLEEKDELGLLRMTLDIMEHTTEDNGEQVLLSFKTEYKDLQNPLQIYVKKEGSALL
jgi:hypothetical protein